MKTSIYLLTWLFLPGILAGQSTALFQDDRVCSIYIDMPPDSFQHILDEKINDRYLKARFIFDDGALRDTVQEVGFRLRGNTSLNAAKKSFKISFNAFVAGREYQGVRKINLRGQANDPTLIREKLYYEIWRDCRLPERRASFVRLFVNGAYRGLYTNMEELDKQWLTRAYGDNDGNFYKCLWPADLVWLGNDQQVYKNIMHNAAEGERAYQLVTNESADDYSRFVSLVSAINQPITINYVDQLNQMLNIEQVLMAYAIDVSTGNWDDYFYLKNNYYLYDNPVNGKFEWVTYDTDNCLGIDWVSRDWGQRNCLNWHNQSEPRPLASQLLAVPELKELFIHYLDSITNHVTCPEILYPRVDALHTLITPDAAADPFRPLDFGYSVDDFHASFDQALDAHTPYGLKPFIETRCLSTRMQIAPFLSSEEASASLQAKVFPNPALHTINITLPEDRSGVITFRVYDVQGRFLQQGEMILQQGAGQITLEELSSGFYCLYLLAPDQAFQVRFIRL